MNAIFHRTHTLTRLGAVALSAALTIGLVAVPACGLSQQSVTVVLNGQTVTFDQPPIIQAGRAFVPLRGIFEDLGATVVYANGQINATGRGRTVSLTIGSTQATVDGQPVTLDVAPFVVGSRTLVPLRFIAQSLGASVNWNDSTSTVTIASSGRPPGSAVPASNVTFTYQAPTGTIYSHAPQIRFQLNRTVAAGDLQVRLDGRDVTSEVQSNGNYFDVPAPWALPPGTHTVRVRGTTVRGAPFDLAWSFEVS